MKFQEAIAILQSSELSRYAKELPRFMRPSARIEVADHIATNSYFGGKPQLPVGASWPHWDSRPLAQRRIEFLEQKYRDVQCWQGLIEQLKNDFPVGPEPLMFLGQLDLGELHRLFELPEFPTAGQLAFFSHKDVAGFDPYSAGNGRVLYVPPNETLEELCPPDSLPKDYRFTRRNVGFKQEWTLPTHLEIRGETQSAQDSKSAYGRVACQLAGNDAPVHRLAGCPQVIQADMRLQCQLASNGIYCGNRDGGCDDPRCPELRDGAEDWRLLLQIDSDETNLGWMWGDAGRLYFWIRHSDLLAKRFDHVWLIQQCY